MQLNLTPGVTPLSHDIYLLHMTLLFVCVGIGLVVFGVILYTIIFHRQARGYKGNKRDHNLRLEIAWTVIPFFILILVAIPGTKVLIEMNDFATPDVTIKITGYQWKWQYDYLNEGIQFFSNLSTPADQLAGKAAKGIHYLQEVDRPLVVPIHKKIRFLVTSNDVIHSWWVMAFGVKRDAVPGFINESWARINRAGTYRGQCAELCGMHHAFMPIVVEALTEKDYANWVSQQKGGSTLAASANKPTVWTLETLIKHGEQVYQTTCAACHKPDGTGQPPVFPNLKTSPVTRGPVAKHIHTVVFGVPGTAMQAFGKQLTPEDIAAVITFERNNLAAQKNELVQPADIIAAEKGT